MRTMLKVVMQPEAASRAVRDGVLPELFQSTVNRLHPEAAYFGLENGNRTAYLIFDFDDQTQMPAIAEPLFNALNAQISLSPVMSWEELQKGLGKLQKR
jgi:hypothetical protein